MEELSVLIATNNLHKIEEFRRIWANYPWRIVTPRQLGLDLDVDETGRTFDENACLKAEAFALASGMPSLADDSGIEVDALDGAPGIFSARYGPAGLDDSGRVRHLVSQLIDVPQGERQCRYRASLALALPEGTQVVTSGVCEGVVAFAPKGVGGFGYDPIFFIPELDRTMAELTASEKDQISHRGRAARQMSDRLHILHLGSTP